MSSPDLRGHFLVLVHSGSSENPISNSALSAQKLPDFRHMQSGNGVIEVLTVSF